MKKLMMVVLAVGAACAAGAVEYKLDAASSVRSLPDDPRYDVRPGLKMSCRVKFDVHPSEKGQMSLLQKGHPNAPGSFWLRVDGPKESVKFSFFVNLGKGPEPRVSVLGAKDIEVGKWYDVAAGWDGTNTWITVNGKTSKKRRMYEGEAAGVPLPRKELPGCAGPLVIGSMLGTMVDPVVDTPAPPVGDTAVVPGVRLACSAKFLREPTGETTIIQRKNGYWLRYDKRANDAAGAFNLFMFLNGGWEPRASVQMPIEIGRTYRLSGGWTGKLVSLDVDDVVSEPIRRGGRCTRTDAKLGFGDPGAVSVTDFRIRNERRPLLSFGMFRTRELMPRAGAPATLKVDLLNIGTELGPCTVVARGKNGVAVTPERIEIASLDEGDSHPLEWRVDAGTNGLAYLDFTVEQNGKELAKAGKRVVFMPVEDPDFSAKVWNPPVKPTRTWYFDADAGDDARDGLTPQTAWRTFKNVEGMELGPGERLLLKRGCVFNGDLLLSARGSAENWAEIGAYGEGMRPRISRNRHLNDRCGWVRGAAYLVVHDLIFSNAGSGFTVECSREGDGHILIERCLAHHIEGQYRFNSHGIPEWWDEPGPKGGSRSTGMAVSGNRARHIVMRDCESYQCSSGFKVSGVDTFVNRMFCHDNYAHNTSPHPYNLASRSWMTDCVFDASGWHAPAGTMGIMLAGNDGWIVRGCHFLNQPDSGSPDQGGIDFEASGENCLVDRCTFRNNAGAAIEVLGLRSPQTRNVQIRGCKFDRNNWSYKNGPAEIQVWGSPGTGEDVACSNGRIEGNGYVLVPGVPFYVNHSRTTNDWILANNKEFDFAEELDKAFPYVDPPEVRACGEIWTDDPVAALSARVCGKGAVSVAWEQVEGPAGVAFAKPSAVCTKATFPGEGDYRVQLKADNGTLWRTSRTAVHVLPAGARTFGAWDFSKPLDAQGWRAENTGTSYRFLPGKVAFWNSESFPVRLVCGDYYVIAMLNAAGACLVTPDDRDTGVSFTPDRANAVRVKMMNHTDSAKMRLWWQTDGTPEWKEENSVAFDVKAQDVDDAVYTVPMPRIGGIKQFRLSFSADGSPVTGTCRIDYIWAGHLPDVK
ncbi:MAG: right-handed parallel beta-helix repeat-containing protein [Kiritimatiellae bacterium]|nr:right-handed parallel beta-helix repeat-containing protein [Kiritimatiellia bacterium]